MDEQIGRMLDHFLVHDRHDLQALQQLARSIGWQGVTITVCSVSLPHPLCTAKIGQNAAPLSVTLLHSRACYLASTAHALLSPEHGKCPRHTLP